MDIAKRTLNMVRAALIFAIAVYMFIGGQVTVGKPGPLNTMLFQILAVVAVVNIRIMRMTVLKPIVMMRV